MNFCYFPKISYWRIWFVCLESQRWKSGSSSANGCQASLVAEMVKNLPAMQETQVWSLGWEDSLEKGMATHSSILAWRIPMDRGAWWAYSLWGYRVRHDWVIKHRMTFITCDYTITEVFAHLSLLYVLLAGSRYWCLISLSGSFLWLVSAMESFP